MKTELRIAFTPPTTEPAFGYEVAYKVLGSTSAPTIVHWTGSTPVQIFDAVNTPVAEFTRYEGTIKALCSSTEASLVTAFTTPANTCAEISATNLSSSVHASQNANFPGTVIEVFFEHTTNGTVVIRWRPQGSSVPFTTFSTYYPSPAIIPVPGPGTYECTIHNVCGTYLSPGRAFVAAPLPTNVPVFYHAVTGPEVRSDDPTVCNGVNYYTKWRSMSVQLTDEYGVPTTYPFPVKISYDMELSNGVSNGTLDFNFPANSSATISHDYVSYSLYASSNDGGGNFAAPAEDDSNPGIVAPDNGGGGNTCTTVTQYLGGHTTLPANATPV